MFIRSDYLDSRCTHDQYYEEIAQQINVTYDIKFIRKEEVNNKKGC